MYGTSGLFSSFCCGTRSKLLSSAGIRIFTQQIPLIYMICSQQTVFYCYDLCHVVYTYILDTIGYDIDVRYLISENLRHSSWEIIILCILCGTSKYNSEKEGHAISHSINDTF